MENHVTDVATSFKWVGWIPLKINCFVWRMIKKNRIHLVPNLMRRGIVVSSSLCTFCHDFDEGLYHIFFSCGYVSLLWKWLVEWS